MAVTVVDYDPSWPGRFEALRDEYAGALAAAGVAVIGIEHVGSTSVPGMAAKPVIDVDIVVAEADVAAAGEVLVGLGFEHLGDLGIPQRWAFTEPARLARTNTYVVVAGSEALRNHLAVRDTLRAHPALRAEYSAVKKRVGAVAADIDEYLRGKSGIVRRILAATLVAEVEDRGDRVFYRDAIYAQVSGFRPLLLDLEVPVAPSPVAVVVYLHGGGFAGGTHKTSGDALGAKVRAELVGRGIAVAAVGYRLSGEARFPAQVHDVKAAVRWLREHAGPLGLDPRRIGAWGGSAGGYLAAMLAVTDGHPDLDGRVGSVDQSGAVAAAVSWYGLANLATQPPLGPPGSGNTDPGASPEAKLLGAPLETIPELAAFASPVTHVSPRSAPLLLVHGDRDRGVPLAQSSELAAAYRRAGAPVELSVVAGGDHGFPGLDLTPLLGTSVDFLDRHLQRRD